jgi:hypothetical protein
MAYVIFFLVVLLLGGVAYLWWKYGKKLGDKGGNSWWDSSAKKKKSEIVVPLIHPAKTNLEAIMTNLEKIEPQKLDEAVVEITEADIANINRIPELITAIEGMAMVLKRNGSKEISLEEALGQISGPATLVLTPEETAELSKLFKTEVASQPASKKPDHTAAVRQARRRRKVVQEKNADSVHQPE